MSEVKKYAWMRQLEITFTSYKNKQKLTFGNNWKNGGIDLNIEVSGTKYLSTLRDKFTIRITNLTYKEITELINGQFYQVEIKCGYRTSGLFTVFKGGVLYISNELGDRKSNDVVILCASEMVSRYGQARMNLSLKSGVNMYSALDYIKKRAGINNAYIDEDFKHRILRESEVANTNITSWLDMISQSNNWITNADYSEGASFSIWNPYRKDMRRIKLTTDNIILTGGYPRLDSSGLEISLMPTFNFMPGDTINIDNSIIDIGTSSENEALKNVGQFLDKDGNYVITEISVNLQNRGSSFSFKCRGRAKSLWNNILGGLS